MINIYDFNYDSYRASCKIEIDTEKFTEKQANETLTFFSWDYDKESNPIDEVAKKYAILIIEKSTEGYSISDIKRKNFEGFYRLTGESGIKLLEVDGFEFEESDLSFKKSVITT